MSSVVWNFPAAIELVVAVPLLALLLAVPLGRHAGRLMAPMAVAMPLLALWLVADVAADGVVERHLGGWSPPLGIALRADGLAAAFVLLAAVVLPASGLFARARFGDETRETVDNGTFWPLFMALWAAINGIFVSGDLFNLYVAIELLTLSAVGLVAYDAIAAAMRYLVFALVGSLAYLLGVVLLYARYASLDLMHLAGQIEADPTTLVAAALMTSGLMVKTAIFPLHAWAPPARAGAIPAVSALLSALVTKAAFYIFARLWLDLLPGVASNALTQLLGALGAAAILVGSVMALRVARLKMLVAYSTVAQFGYLFLLFPLAGGASAEMHWAASAWSGGMMHALAHGLAKAAMFLAAGLMAEALGHDRLDGLAGIGRSLPLTTFAFALAAVSLMGLPPSGGFVAKYLLLTSAFASGQLVWAAVLILGGLLAAAYLFRPLGRAMAKTEPALLHPVARARELLPLGLALLALALGILPGPVYVLLQIGRPEAAAEGLE